MNNNISKFTLGPRFQTTKSPATMDDYAEIPEFNSEDPNDEEPKFDFSPSLDDMINGNNKYAENFYKELGLEI